jgi:glycosyltransferase involved in cell wall biosynthesis
MLELSTPILLVHNRYQHYGGEDTVFDSVRNLLEEHGHRVATLEFDSASIPDDPSLLDNARLAMNTIWSRSSAARVFEAARDHKARIVHFHNTFPLVSPAAYGAARRAGAAVIQCLPNYRLICPSALLYRENSICRDCVSQIVPWPSVLHACYRGSRFATSAVGAMLVVHRLLRTWQRNVDLFETPSEATREEYLRAGFHPEQIVVRPNFADEPGPQNASKRGGFLYVGRVERPKGLQTLLAAWSQLAEGDAVPELRIIGSGPMSSEVQKLAARCPQVLFDGPASHDEVISAMSEASVLLFPSESLETFGLTVTEAFASGTPAIVAAVGAPSDLIEEGKTGLHFRPGDVADLVTKVRWAVDHPAAMAQMGLAARAEYEKKFSAARNYDLLIDTYHQALARRNIRS